MTTQMCYLYTNGETYEYTNGNILFSIGQPHRSIPDCANDLVVFRLHKSAIGGGTMQTTIDNKILAEQLQREEQMKDGGSARYLNRQAKHHSLSQSDSHHQLILSALERVAEAIRNSIYIENNKGSGRKHLWCSLLEDHDADALAYIGLNQMMDSVANSTVLTTCVTNIGRRIETEVWAKEFKAVSKEAFNHITEVATDNQSGLRRRVDSAKFQAESRGFKLQEWPLTKCTTVAIPVVNAILEFSGVFYIHEEYSKNNTVKTIRILSDVREALKDQAEAARWQEPMFSAMIIPPIPWTAIDTGCYRDHALSRHVPLVKGATYQQKQTIKRDFAKSALVGEVPKYVQAINALQAVPLKINKAMLKMVSWCWDEGKEFGKFPSQLELFEPERLDNWSDLDRDEQKRHISNSKTIRQKNLETRTASIVMQRDINTAADLSQFDEFYLPWNLDSRGRCYSVSTFNYHRDDHIKSLFMLGNGAPLCDETHGWLMIHITNLGDFGKASKRDFEGRIDWFLENEHKILEVVLDPQGTFDFWSEADKPMQFLAACIEWGQYKFFGNGYMCHLAPALDGSCSSTQHYSAASLSEDTGKLVNLVPMDVPQDVYQTLADAVNKVLLEMSQDSSIDSQKQEMAQLWLDYGVDRKTLKTNCMTFGYSSVAFGFGVQLFDQIMTPLTDKILHSASTEPHPFGTKKQQQEHANFLASISFQCVGLVLSSAKEGMEFFMACAKALAQENKPMSWVTPIGFPVVQKYTKWNTKKVKVYLYDRVLKSKKRAQFSLKVDVRDEAGRKQIDVKKAKSGISPNIIHSMDSSHLMATVLALKENGINDFMMIHDSFAVLPNYTPDLFDLVRQTFIQQYSEYDMYQEIKKSTLQQLSDPDKLKDVKEPTIGNLDLKLIADSDFCFA